jgi:hypothetical protein
MSAATARSHLYRSRPAAVEVDERRRPLSLDGIRVEAVREEWLVEDGWWTARPLRRHYFELVLADGRCEVIFRTPRRWWRQRA